MSSLAQRLQAYQAAASGSAPASAASSANKPDSKVNTTPTSAVPAKPVSSFRGGTPPSASTSNSSSATGAVSPRVAAPQTTTPALTVAAPSAVSSSLGLVATLKKMRELNTAASTPANVPLNVANTVTSAAAAPAAVSPSAISAHTPSNPAFPKATPAAPAPAPVSAPAPPPKRLSIYNNLKPISQAKPHVSAFLGAPAVGGVQWPPKNVAAAAASTSPNQTRTASPNTTNSVSPPAVAAPANSSRADTPPARAISPAPANTTSAASAASAIANSTPSPTPTTPPTTKAPTLSPSPTQQGASAGREVTASPPPAFAAPTRAPPARPAPSPTPLQQTAAPPTASTTAVSESPVPAEMLTSSVETDELPPVPSYDRPSFAFSNANPSSPRQHHHVKPSRPAPSPLVAVTVPTVAAIHEETNRDSIAPPPPPMDQRPSYVLNAQQHKESIAPPPPPMEQRPSYIQAQQQQQQQQHKGSIVPPPPPEDHRRSIISPHLISARTSIIPGPPPVPSSLRSSIFMGNGTLGGISGPIRKSSPPPPPPRKSFISPSNVPLIPDTTSSAAAAAASPSTPAFSAAPTPSLPPRLRGRSSVSQNSNSDSRSSISISSTSLNAPSPLLSPTRATPPPRASPLGSPASPTSSTSALSPSSSRSGGGGGTLSDDEDDGLSFLDALRDTAPQPLSQKERNSIALSRQQRTKTMMSLQGEESIRQKHPDYCFAPNPYDADDPSTHLSSEAQVQKDRWFDAYGVFQERHAKAWKTQLDWFDPRVDPTGEQFAVKLKDKRVKTLVKSGGIPASWRGAIWEILVGSRKLRMENKGYYTGLLQQLQAHPTKSTRDIEKDVTRTMHNHQSYSEVNGIGQQQLKRALCAFSFRCPTIGYAQSMSTIMATLLLHYLDEEDAFWIFDRLLLSILPADYYTPSMLGVKTDCAILKKLVKKRLPKVWTHFFKLHVDLDMVSLPWFMCLFVHVLPLLTAMRIWDALIYKGSHVLLSVAVALLAKHEDELLTLKSMGEIFQRLQVLGKEEYDCETLIQLALGKHHVRAVDAAKMREEVRAEFEREYLSKLNFKS